MLHEFPINYISNPLNCQSCLSCHLEPHRIFVGPLRGAAPYRTDLRGVLLKPEILTDYSYFDRARAKPSISASRFNLDLPLSKPDIGAPCIPAMQTPSHINNHYHILCIIIKHISFSILLTCILVKLGKIYNSTHSHPARTRVSNPQPYLRDLVSI